MLEGGREDPRFPPPADEWRIYQLVKITGWTINEIDACPAVTIDWILACAALEIEIENDRQAAANRR